MEAYLGMIMAVAFNFIPRGWAPCDGRLLSIAQYSALYALLGNSYGGDGRTTFALPDLRGRTLVGMGAGMGLQPVVQGQMWGSDNVTVTANGNAMVAIDAAHLPKHNHPVSINAESLTAASTLHATASGPGTTAPSEGAALGATGSGPSSAAIYVGNGATAGVALNTGSVTTKLAGQVDTTSGENSGNGAPFAVPVTTSATASVMQPSLGINYLICLEGIFPSRE